MITSTILQKLVKDKTGLDVEIVSANPVVYAEVSMDSLGFIGNIFVFKDEHAKLKAVPVPFAFGST